MAVVASSAAAEDQQARLQSEMDTRALSRAVGWLRPFVETMGWEYVVVWKIADDPSRFIEWIGCCCSGFMCENVKEEKELYAPLAPLCRDGCSKHYVRTRACEALSRLPSLMPLYSGIHGEVVIANEYRWISPSTYSTPNSSPEAPWTQVLIPVTGGIIELFNKKIVPEEPKILELITIQCQLFSNQESMMMSLNGLLSLKNCSSNSLVQILTPTAAHFPQLLAPGTLHCSSYEGSSSSSGPSNENIPIEYLQSRDAQKFIRHQTFSGINHNRENILKTSCRSQDGESGSKNLLAERRRRNKIKERLFALRAIVPKISKMDRAAILADAMDYIQELKEEIKGLQDELKKMEEEDCQLKDREIKFPMLNVNSSFDSKSPIVKDGEDHSCLGLPDKKEVQVEVKQIGNRALLVRLLCEKTGGWFSRLMEVLCSLGLMVLDVNITTLNNKALTILSLEGQKDIHPKKLKDSLTKVAISRSLITSNKEMVLQVGMRQ
ncbi:hypothetical protein SAY86_002413 [Trapa natans]|uniref:BHLH domain-containing protein n=1 Tax=Trapa natans TaxID=22666 RepID=A0AAN7LJ31_TRANT|nr:hypothetical protein SAY86_002413 [Trapa natans]